MDDIVCVVDCMISYMTKGAETSAIERKNIKNFIMNYIDNSNDYKGLRSLARKWLNRASTSRTISRQETAFLLSGLPLTFSYETIEFISTTRKYNGHDNEGNNLHDETDKTTKSWMKQYEFRKNYLNENFEDYVFRKLNESRDDDKPIIPHFTGTLQICPCPLTESYAYQALTVFMPWSHDNPIKKNRNDECLPKLKGFLKVPNALFNF